MREFLEKYAKRKVFVEATVIRFGYHTSSRIIKPKGQYDNVLLREVTLYPPDSDEGVSVDHLWIPFSEEIREMGIKAGHIISFSAYIYEYVKGKKTVHPKHKRTHKNPKAIQWNTQETSYGVRRINNLEILDFIEDVPSDRVVYEPRERVRKNNNRRANNRNECLSEQSFEKIKSPLS